MKETGVEVSDIVFDNELRLSIAAATLSLSVFYRLDHAP